MTCKDCIHDEVCDVVAVETGIPFVNANTCPHYKNKADFVEVTRCKDCGFRDDNLITTSQNIDCYMCKRHHSLVLLNDYCSYGKRK